MKSNKKTNLLDGLNQLKPQDLVELQQKLEKKLKHNSWLTIALMVILFFTLIYVVGFFNQEKSMTNDGGEAIPYSEMQELKEHVQQQDQRLNRLERELEQIKQQTNKE